MKPTIIPVPKEEHQLHTAFQVYDIYYNGRIIQLVLWDAGDIDLYPRGENGVYLDDWRRAKNQSLLAAQLEAMELLGYKGEITMPNYKLSPNIIKHMTEEGNKLCERRVAHMNVGFPIGYEKLQAAILPARWRDVILEMKREGITALYATTDLNVTVNADGIERAAKIYVKTKHEMLFCHERHTIQLDLSVLSDDELSGLISWVNTSVRERRLANIAMNTIMVFLNCYADSSGHVVARWPALTTLINPKIGYSAHERQILAGWRTKFASPPRNLKPYGWEPMHNVGHGWRTKNEKAMKLTEMILTSASLLPEKVEDSAEVKASISSWTPIAGDLDKP